MHFHQPEVMLLASHKLLHIIVIHSLIDRIFGTVSQVVSVMQARDSGYTPGYHVTWSVLK